MTSSNLVVCTACTRSVHVRQPPPRDESYPRPIGTSPLYSCLLRADISRWLPPAALWLELWARLFANCGGDPTSVLVKQEEEHGTDGQEDREATARGRAGQAHGRRREGAHALHREQDISALAVTLAA